MNKIVKNIFITGGSGYLGSALIRRLIDNGYIVYCLRRSISKVDRLENISKKIFWVDDYNLNFDKFFEINSIDYILHCATNYGRNEQDPIATIDANLLLPLRILNAASKHGVKAFINTDTILDKRINHYSLSKNHFYDWLLNYSNIIKCVNIKLEHFYGPNDDPTKFISYILNELLNNSDCIDLTAGHQKRDFIYIDDVVSAFISIIDSIDKSLIMFDEYQVGTGYSISIRDVVNLMKELTGNSTTSLNFGKIPYRYNEIMNPKINIIKLSNLGWAPKYNIAEGLIKMIGLEKIK